MIEIKQLVKYFGKMAGVAILGAIRRYGSEQSEDVRRVLDEFNRGGLTSKLINLPDLASFLVLNDRFEEEVRKRIYILAENLGL